MVESGDQLMTTLAECPVNKLISTHVILVNLAGKVEYKKQDANGDYHKEEGIR